MNKCNCKECSCNCECNNNLKKINKKSTIWLVVTIVAVFLVTCALLYFTLFK